MADVKASELIPWLSSHLGDGYVYGTVGQTCTITLLQAKQRQYGASMGNGYYQLNGDYSKGKCARWLGRWVADCSGLIKAGRKAISGVYRDVSAEGTYQQCYKRGKVGSTMPVTPGCTVYMWNNSMRRMSHVGVYIGKGKVIEARGVGYGVVQTDFRTRKWGYWGLLGWLELDLPTEGGSYIPNPDASTDKSDSAGQLPGDKPCTGIPKLAALGDTGYDIKLLQQWLNLHGANPKVVEDGVFGAKTEAAVIGFKNAHGLLTDGVACIQTWKALIAPPPAVPLTLSTIKQGASGVLVELLQRLLYTAGITPWDVDGQFGDLTNLTVRVYQRARGLAVDGVVGPQTWPVLVKNEPTVPVTVKRGSSGDEVKYLQRMLTDKGFAPGPIDGEFGQKTEAAVDNFQLANGLAANGVVGPETWGKLLADPAQEN